MRNLLLTAGIVLLLLVAWWFGQEPGRNGETQGPVRGSDPAAEAAARLEGRARPPAPRESSPTAERGFSLRAWGRVVDESKHGMADVTVVALEARPQIGWGTGPARALRSFRRPLRTRPRVVARTTTDEEGRFGLEGLASDRAHHIQARPGAPLTWVNAWFHPTYKPHEELVLVVKRGSALRIRVVDDGDGTGVQTRIDVWSRGRGALVEGARTDADGRFVTPFLPAGRVTLHARIPGLVSVSRTVVAPHDEEIVLALGGGGDAVVTGTTRDEAGMALANVEVVLNAHAKDGRALTVATQTDAAGRYRFEGLAEGSLSWLLASAPDRLLARFGAGHRKLEPGGVIEADFVLLPGFGIRGQVVDEQGAPIPEVRIYAAVDGMPPPHAHEDLTDADGRFAVGPFPAGPVSLGTQKPGWYQVEKTEAGLRSDRPRHRVVALDGPVEVEVVLLRGLSVPGRCTDPEGRGVGDLLVTATPDWQKLRGLYPLWSTAARVARSDREGHFTFEGLAPGIAWQFEAKGEGHEGKTGMLGPWPAGAAVKPFVVEVRGTARIQGRVIGADGQGVEGVRVSEGGSKHTESGPDGVFELGGLARRSVILRAYGAQARVLGQTQIEDLQPGETRGGAEIHVPAASRITGTLVTEAGEASADTVLVFRDVSGSGHVSWAETDAEGRFTARLWGPGPFEPTVEGRALSTQVVAGQDDVRLVRPEPLPTLQVRILDPAGEPLPRVHVVIHYKTPSNNASFTQEVDGGLLRLRGPHRAAGTRLRLTKARGASGEPLNLVPRDVVLGDEGDELVVRLEAGALIRGRVLDEHGAAVPGIRVQATSTAAGDPAAGAPRRTVTTDESGQFQVPGLPRAGARLRALPEDPWLPTPSVEIDGVGQEATLRVQRGVPFEISVSNEKGDPVGDASVRMSGRWEDRPWRRVGTTDAEGRVTFEGVAPGGGYAVSARPGGADSKRYPPTTIEHVPYGAGELAIVMRAGLWIEGEVVDPDGKPVLRSRVVAGIGYEDRAATARLDGRSNHFALGPLRPGTYRLRARGSRPWGDSQVIEVAAPARDVRLVLTRKATIEGRVTNVEGRSIYLQCADGEVADGGELPEDGRFSLEIRDLPVTLYAADPKGTVCAMVEGARPADGPFELTLVEAASIGGLIEGWPPKGEQPWVRATHGPLALWCPIEKDGRFTLGGVPPGSGPWKLELRTEDEVLTRRDGVMTGATGLKLKVPEAAD